MNYLEISKLILLIEPLPNINQVFSLVLQQERRGKNYSDTKVLVNSTSENQ